MMDSKDYYKILEIDSAADVAEIKKAYKKLAIKYHPDRNPDDTAASEKMSLLNEAYAVLSNPDKRREYDHLKQRFGADAAGHFRQSNSYEDILRHSDIEKIFQEISDNFGIRGLNDLFKMGGSANNRGFFFFGTFGGTSQSGFGERGSTHHLNGEHQAFFQPNSASKPGQKSHQKILSHVGNTLLKRAVNTLLGDVPSSDMNIRDTIVLSPSHAKDGGPYAYYHKERDKKLLVKVPPNVKDEHKIRLKGAGHEDPESGARGDLYLTVNVKNNLISKVKRFFSK